MSVRVLIADSSGKAREVMRHHLDCMGCNVVAETDNAAQTANLFRTIRPQVIILDIGLKAGGDLDALGLVRMIRAESPDSATILVCPANEPQRSEPFMDEGALECLVEPLAKEGFERVWHKLLTRFPELRPPELPRAKAARRPRGNSQ